MFWHILQCLLNRTTELHQNAIQWCNFSDFHWWICYIWVRVLTAITPHAMAVWHVDGIMQYGIEYIQVIRPLHYNNVIMSAMAFQITSLTIVYSTVYSRRRSKKTSKLRVGGLGVGNSSVTGEFPAQRASNTKMFPFDDVIMSHCILFLYLSRG